MKHIIKSLSECESYLRNLQKEKEQELRLAPEGTLRIDKRKKGNVYFHRKSKEHFNGDYIRKKNLELAEALAQKDYNISKRQVVLRIFKSSDFPYNCN